MLRYHSRITELALDKMRLLCEEKGITFLFVKAQCLASQWYDRDEKQVRAYVGKYSIPYINFYDLMKETGVDYETDTYDSGFHLNPSGVDKISDYLGEELKQGFCLRGQAFPT